MITILRHTVVFGTGEIISVFPVDHRNGYEVADLEKERLRLLKQYIDNGTATCVRLVDLGITFPANEKCILHLANGFRVATPEEAAKILVKEYCNE